jgi:hypothetical protein
MRGFDPLNLSEQQLLILDLLSTHPLRGWTGRDLVNQSAKKLSMATIYTQLDYLGQWGYLVSIEEQLSPDSEQVLPRFYHWITPGGKRQRDLQSRAAAQPGLTPGWSPIYGGLKL